MDLAGIAAILALAGIPVTALVGRWQARTALQQADKAHRSAMDVAEASHRSALEAAEKAHEHALELLRRQSHLEADQWVREKRHAAYSRFQEALSQAHAAGATEPCDPYELHKARRELHVSHHEAYTVANRRVASLIHSIAEEAMNLCSHRAGGQTVENFTHAWSITVSSRRRHLDEEIREGLDLDAEISTELRQGRT